MANRSFYRGGDSALLSGSKAFAAKITAAPGGYGLTTEQAARYAAATGAFDVAMMAAADPMTRTRGNVQAKNQTAADLRKATSDLAQVVNGTAGVTEQQKIQLGLAVRGKGSPIPAPSKRPTVTLVNVDGRSVTVSVADGDTRGRRRRADGAVAAWVYSFVGERYPSDPSQWAFQGATTRGVFEITFADAAAGTQVWACAAWINAKQQVGPMSLPLTTHVHVGGVGRAGALKAAA